MIASTFETMGYPVYCDMVSYAMVREVSGGLALVLWRKLSGWMNMIRKEQQQPSFAEWFQWLADQLARESAAKEASPAYEKFADWKPRRT